MAAFAPPGKIRRIEGASSTLSFKPLVGLDDEASTDEPRTYRANDHIDLFFVDPAADDFVISSPEFTHQLFPDETIDFISTRQLEDDESFLKTSVVCRLGDLRHLVLLPHSLSSDETHALRSGLQGALPADTIFLPHTDDLETAIEDFASQGPPAVRIGQLLHTFTAAGGATYEIWLASDKDPGCTNLVGRFEKAAVWFIETADSVDFCDDRWQCLFLAKRNQSAPACTYSLVGYYTLFTFRNPFAGSRLRICQALILPPFQGQGLGRQMLLAVYRMARDNAEVVEVTVEDPAPGFQAMRDSVDFDWSTEIHPMIRPGAEPTIADAAAMAARAKNLAAELKLTAAQVQAILEAEQLHSLTALTVPRPRHDKTQPMTAYGFESESSGSEAMTALRLLVKRRLLGENPDLRALPRTEMQAQLEELYVEQLVRLEALAGRMARASKSV